MRITLQTLLIVLCSLIMANSLAQVQNNIVHPGFYLGVEAGASDVSYKNNLAPGYRAGSINSTGFATRIETGFDITKYFGTLLSVIYFHKPEFHDINGSANAKTKNNLIFLALKGMLPIGNRFVISVNGGVGYIVRNKVVAQGFTVFPDREIVRPVYGLGLGYLIWKRWIATFTWIQATQKTSEHLPNANFIGIGIRYKFAS